MKFKSHERAYEVDQYGVVTQTDARPFKYDPKYSAIYDKPEYREGSNILQALRFGFVQAAHGRPINTLLDVGYGNGAFIDFIKKHVPYVYGHDITGVPLDGAYSLPEMVKAEVYTFWDVLEHFPSLDFLRTIPVETICLSLPYCHFITEGIDWFNNAYHHRKPDEHIRHFNPTALVAFMAAHGWRCTAFGNQEDMIRRPKNEGLQNIISAAFKRNGY